MKFTEVHIDADDNFSNSELQQGIMNVRNSPMRHFPFRSDWYCYRTSTEWMMNRIIGTDRYCSDQNFCRGSPECKMSGGSDMTSQKWYNTLCYSASPLPIHNIVFCTFLPISFNI